MRDLTAADVAFLLCTAKLGSFELSLSTDFGLFLDVNTNGNIFVSLDRPHPSPGRPRRRSTAPSSLKSPSPIRNSIDAVMLTPTSTISPAFPSSHPLSSFSPGTKTNISQQFQSDLPTPSHSPRTAKPPAIKTIYPTTWIIPTPESTPLGIFHEGNSRPHPGYKYIITPSYNPNSHSQSRGATLLASGTSNYLFYSPDWPHNPRSSTLSSLSTPPHSPKPPPTTVIDSQHDSELGLLPPPEIQVNVEDLEARYSSSTLTSSGIPSGSVWLDSYLDWVSRSQRAMARSRRREERRRKPLSLRTTALGQDSGSSSEEGDITACVHGQKTHLVKKDERRGPFKDEGESTLWMVEGLLLVAWLSLQVDCAGVEYAPWGFTPIRTSNSGGKREKHNTGCNTVSEKEEPVVYLLKKDNLGRVIQGVLRGLTK